MAKIDDEHRRDTEEATLASNNLDDSTTPTTPAAPVVTIDCSSPNAHEAIRDALSTIGCFYAVGLGIKRKTVASLLSRSRDFFSSPLETKLKIKSDSNFRGFTPMNDEKLGGDGAEDDKSTVASYDTLGDFKEGVYFGRDLTDARHPLFSLPLHGPNQWPSDEDAPGYKKAVEDSFVEFRSAAAVLLRLVALGLGVDEAFFVRKCSSGGGSGVVEDEKDNSNEGESAAMDFVRTLHYAPRRSRPELGEMGANAHRDYGFATLLVTDGVPGLQVFDEHGNQEWCLVPPAAPWPPVNDAGTTKRPPPAANPSMLRRRSDESDEETNEEEFAVFVNGGDMLHRWSNGLFTSALHRVALSEDVDRYSAAYFFDPPWSCVVEPITTSTTEEETTKPPLFSPTTYGEYLVEKFKKTHASFEEAAGGEVERRKK